MWLLSNVHKNSTQIERFCSKSERLIFNDPCNISSKFLQNAKFGPVKLKELCVFLAWFFFFLFLFLFVLFCCCGCCCCFLYLPPCAYIPHITRFQFQKCEIFSSWEGTSLLDIPRKRIQDLFLKRGAQIKDWQNFDACFDRGCVRRICPLREKL